jgi:type I restriction enzyme M protein
LQGIVAEIDSPLPEFDISEAEKAERFGYLQGSNYIGNAMIPKYYDPSINAELRSMHADFNMMTIGHLVDRHKIVASSGIEVGKMAYGTGDVPFVRTSDLGSWELRGQAKQLVAAELLDAFGEKLDAVAGDILLVRDGTYLVGTSALITEHDGPLLFSGGIYKLRCIDYEQLDPYLLIALLNMPIVRRQMRAKQFTRDVIDTLGRRLFEVVLPVPRSRSRRKEISDLVRATLAERSALRARMRDVVADLEV